MNKQFSLRQRAIACSKKIKGQFPNTCEGRLAYAIYNAALVDLVDAYLIPMDRQSAISFLCSDSDVALNAGVDPVWIRDMILKAGLSLNLIDYSIKYTNKRI